MTKTMEIGTAALNSRASVRVTIKNGKIDLRIVSKLNDLTGLDIPIAKVLII